MIEQIKKNKRKRKKKRLNHGPNNNTTLKLPFLSAECSARIRRAATSLNIPVQVVTTPGRKLRDLLTSSRPLDRPHCPNNNCKTCEALSGEGKCTDSNLVYSITCQMEECKRQNIGHYNGETYRPINERFVEHYRSANNPTADSYKDKPLAKHYSSKHPEHSGPPKLKLQIVSRASSTTDRKIKEAQTILHNNPAIPMAELFRRGLRLGPPGSEQVRGGRRRSPPNSISPRNKKFRRGIRRGLGGLPRNKFVPPRIRSDPRRIGGTSAGGMH